MGPSQCVGALLMLLPFPRVLPMEKENYRPLSITQILSKVFEKLISHRLSGFCERSGSFPAAQFAYRKGLVCTDALLPISQQLQQALDCGRESYLIQLDFSSAFDRVSRDGVIFKHGSAGIGGCLLSICREFLTDRRQRVVVDGASSEWIPIVSVVPQGGVLGPLLFILYASEMFDLVENRLFAYADDSTLFAVVHRPSDRPTVAASVNRDLHGSNS